MPRVQPALLQSVCPPEQGGCEPVSLSFVCPKTTEDRFPKLGTKPDAAAAPVSPRGGPSEAAPLPKWVLRASSSYGISVGLNHTLSEPMQFCDDEVTIERASE